MYNFLDPAFPYSEQDCRRMQQEQLEQNLQLLAGAAGQGYDLLVTTECINYIRTTAANTPADAALYPVLEIARLNRWRQRPAEPTAGWWQGSVSGGKNGRTTGRLSLTEPAVCAPCMPRCTWSGTKAGCLRPAMPPAW